MKDALKKMFKPAPAPERTMPVVDVGDYDARKKAAELEVANGNPDATVGTVSEKLEMERLAEFLKTPELVSVEALEAELERRRGEIEAKRLCAMSAITRYRELITIRDKAKAALKTLTETFAIFCTPNEQREYVAEILTSRHVAGGGIGVGEFRSMFAEITILECIHSEYPKLLKRFTDAYDAANLAVEEHAVQHSIPNHVCAPSLAAPAEQDPTVAAMDAAIEAQFARS